MPFFGGGGGDYHIVATNIKGGTQAAPAVIGDNNMALGNGSLQNALNADRNIAVGNLALNGVTTGSDNIGIGYDCASSLEGGTNNVFIGNALDPFSSAVESVAIGSGAEIDSTAVAVGYAASAENDAVSVGHGTLGAQGAVCIGSGTSVTYLGVGVGFNVNAEGDNCIVIGANAKSTGSDSICIGTNSSAPLLSNSIVIGHDTAATVGNEIVIGDSSQTSVVIGGIDFSAISSGDFTSAIIGDPGTEGAGVNINGVVYDSTFKVSDIDGANFAQTILHRHSTILEPLIVGARSNSDTAAHADVTPGMGVFSIFGTGWAGANYKIFGQEQFAADDTGTISNTSAPGKWTLSLTPDGAVTPATVAIARNNKTVEFKAGISVGGATPGASGVAFPAVAVGVANVNTLDDYEEGTFTPGATCATPGDLNAGIIGSTGRYVKIGNRVYFSISIVAIPTYTTATGSVIITGLPFTTSASQNAATFSAQVTNWTAPAGVQSAQGSLVASVTTFGLQKQNNAGSAAFGYALITEFTSGAITSIGASGFYEV